MKESKLLRAKTLDLRLTRPLTEKRQANSKKNEEEALAGKLVLESMPRRFVFELTIHSKSYFFSRRLETPSAKFAGIYPN